MESLPPHYKLHIKADLFESIAGRVKPGCLADLAAAIEIAEPSNPSQFAS